jgi:hypothetical protein
VVSVTDPSGRILDFLHTSIDAEDNQFTDGGEIVSLTIRQPFSSPPPLQERLLGLISVVG